MEKYVHIPNIVDSTGQHTLFRAIFIGYPGYTASFFALFTGDDQAKQRYDMLVRMVNRFETILKLPFKQLCDGMSIMDPFTLKEMRLERGSIDGTPRVMCSYREPKHGWDRLGFTPNTVSVDGLNQTMLSIEYIDLQGTTTYNPKYFAAPYYDLVITALEHFKQCRDEAALKLQENPSC